MQGLNPGLPGPRAIAPPPQKLALKKGSKDVTLLQPDSM